MDCASQRSRSDCIRLDEACREAGIELHFLADLQSETPHSKLPGWTGAAEIRSEQVLFALIALHGSRPLGTVYFSEWQGIAFRSLQSKKAGRHFTSVRMVVGLEGPTLWRHDQDWQWPDGINDLIVDYMEHFSFEHADARVVSSETLANYARENRWVVTDIPLAKRLSPAAPPSGIPTPLEVVYVHRIGHRTHFDKVRDAMARAYPGLPLTQVECQTWKEALIYLSSGNRLALLPDTGGDVLTATADCAAAGVPFLAADTQENRAWVVPELAPQLLFDDADGLVRCLLAYLSTEEMTRHEWRLKCRNWMDETGMDRSAPEEVLFPCVGSNPPENSPPYPDPLVTVCVPHFNLGPFLPATLQSIAAQTFKNLEVIVIDDGSTDPDSLRIFAEQEQLNPGFRFLRQENAGVCSARNRVLSMARGEYFLPLDADNVAGPQLIEVLVGALRNDPDCAAANCFNLHFRDTADLESGAFVGAYRPTGGSVLLGGLINLWGETTGLFRTPILRDIGGYDDLHPMYVSEDWHLYLKLSKRGYSTKVVPEYLYYYRRRESSRFQMGSSYVTHREILTEFARTPSLTVSQQHQLWRHHASLFAVANRQQQHIPALVMAEPPLRYRLADHSARLLRTIPPLYRMCRAAAMAAVRLRRYLTPAADPERD